MSLIDTKIFIFVKSKVFLSSRYPFSISSKELTLLGELAVCLSDELYNNGKSFFKNVPETGAINFVPNLLSFFKNQLQNLSYNIQKTYGFRQKRGFHSLDLNFDNFVMDLKETVSTK